MVLVVVILLFIFGLYWYSTASTTAAQEERTALSQTELLNALQEIQQLPELTCSNAGREESGCVDLYKAYVLNALNELEDETYFQERFFTQTTSNYRLELSQTYPEPAGTTVFDFLSEDPQSTQQVAIPVTVYNAVENKRGLGVLILTQEVTA